MYPTPSQALDIAVRTYIYGYPLISWYVLRERSTSVSVKNGIASAPVNQLGFNGYYSPSTRSLPSPSTDTIYTSVQLDLRNGAYVLHVPPNIQRYWNCQFIDPYTNVVAYLSPRCNLGQAPCYLSQELCVPCSISGGDFLLVGPNDTSRYPSVPSERVVRLPFDDIWIGMRVLVLSTTSPPLTSEIASAQAIQRQFTLDPYDTKIKTKQQQALTSQSVIQTDSTSIIFPDSLAFYDNMGQYMLSAPPPSTDQEILREMASIGVGPGLYPSSNNNLPRIIKAALQQAIPIAQSIIDAEIVANVTKAILTNRGWITPLPNVGVWGTNYLERAVYTKAGIGANIPVEGMYPASYTDIKGNPLTGGQRYVVTFSSVPPVCFFWSLTLYNQNYLLVAPPFSVGDRSSLTIQPDGRFVVRVQPESPNDGTNNWVRSPLTGNFVLVMRFYGPSKDIFDGKWTYPIITPDFTPSSSTTSSSERKKRIFQFRERKIKTKTKDLPGCKLAKTFLTHNEEEQREGSKDIHDCGSLLTPTFSLT